MSISKDYTSNIDVTFLSDNAPNLSIESIDLGRIKALEYQEPLLKKHFSFENKQLVENTPTLVFYSEEEQSIINNFNEIASFSLKSLIF
jgi:hypothetical protein